MVTKFAGLIVTVAWCLAAVPARADFTCEASANRESVPRGGEVVLTVAARGDVGWSPEFKLPDLPGIRLYAGGTNQSMNVVNGVSETSVVRTYYLKVDTDDDFTIGPISILSSQDECATEPITIKVTSAPDKATQVPPANSGNRAPRDRDTSLPPAGANATGQPGEDVFVTLAADHTEAWVGQQIVLTFRYWRRIQPWNNPSYTPPRTEGFWREDLGSERNYRKVVQGRAYNVTEIRYAVFPTRVGDLVIEPAELRFPEGVFDRFFQTRRSRRGPSVLRTEEITVHVKELPTPQARNFSGIVASGLTLTSQVDRDSVPRGEPVGLKVLLSADGFLKGFGGLDIPAPAQTQLHDAGESFQTGLEKDRLMGKISVEKVILPDQEGQLLIPPVEVVWFDSNAGQYKTARTAAWPVTVVASDLPRAGDDASGFLRSEIARLGEDLAFIHPVPQTLSRRAGPFTGGLRWWSMLLLPLLLLAGYRVFLDRVAAVRRDPAGRRLRGALAGAEAQLANREGDRMSAIARAICGYVADCSDRPLAAIGPHDVHEHCRRLELAESGQRLAAILAECDAARYGRVDPRSTEQLASETATLLTKVDQRRRARRGAATGPSLAVLVPLLAVGLALGATPASADQNPGGRPGADPVRLLAEGNQAYTEGDLEAAAARYEQVREAGVNDPVLYFNLGNTYARKGELGQAVASYLRAQRLAPGDRDVRANLAWVRRHIRDLELSEESLPLFIAQFVALVHGLTLDQWGLLLVGLVWAVAALMAWSWYREEVTPALRRFLLGVVAALVIVAAITVGRWYVEQVRESAVVVVAEAVVRSGPAANFSALFEVHDGLTLTIAGRREGWVRVGLGGNWEGWLPAESVVSVRRPSEVGKGRESQGR